MVPSLLLTCLFVVVPTTRQAEVSSEVAALVEQLGSEQFRDRRQAMRGLREQGEAARVALELALDSDDAEVRALARTLLVELGAASRLRESRVSLKLDKVPVADALAALEEAIDFKFVVEPNNWQEFGQHGNVSVDLQDVPLIDALREVIPRCGLSVSEHGQGQLWAWGEQDWPDYPLHRAGAVQIEARRIELNQHASVNLAHGAADRHTNGSITFLVLVEPKLRTLGQPTIEFERVVTPDGKEIRTGPNDYGHHHGQASGGLFHIVTRPLDLSFAEDAPEAIGKLTGTVSLRVETRSDEFVIDNPLENTGETSYLKTDLSVGKLRETGAGRFTVHVKIKNVGEITSDPSFLAGLRLELNDGRTVRPMVPRSRRHEQSIEADLRYQFHNENADNDAPVARPTRLVWHIPLEMEERVIPFEFNDLPLP
ncbi:MAG: hypothetical protein AAGD32_06965 [Planctomycetota bacterium]